MNLSPRLNQLKALITKPYDNIWDGCCDHGLLGQSLLAAYPTSTIHFVDINASIIQALTQKLKLSTHHNWLCHIDDVSNIPMPQSQTNLIILAGIGGQLMLQILEKLLNKIRQDNLENHVEFLLAPIHHQYQLREFLRTQNVSALKEKLVQDNKRFYEILHLSLNGNSLISHIGNELWKNPSDVHHAYLKRLIEHYERLNKNNPTDAKKILDQYRQLAISIGLE